MLLNSERDKIEAKTYIVFTSIKVSNLLPVMVVILDFLFIAKQLTLKAEHLIALTVHNSD